MQAEGAGGILLTVPESTGQLADERQAPDRSRARERNPAAGLPTKLFSETLVSLQRKRVDIDAASGEQQRPRE